MADTTVKKIDSAYSPQGEMGQKYLACGKSIALRLWEGEAVKATETSQRDYEIAGFAVSGRAELEIEGQTVILEPGDSWIVPQGARHSYRILEPFAAVEATTPPARVHGRDEVVTGLTR